MLDLSNMVEGEFRNGGEVEGGVDVAMPDGSVQRTIEMSPKMIRKMVKKGLIKLEPPKVTDVAMVFDIRVKPGTAIQLARDVMAVNPESKLEMENAITAKGFAIKQLNRQQMRQYVRALEKIIQQKLREATRT